MFARWTLIFGLIFSLPLFAITSQEDADGLVVMRALRINLSLWINTAVFIDGYRREGVFYEGPHLKITMLDRTYSRSDLSKMMQDFSREKDQKGLELAQRLDEQLEGLENFVRNVIVDDSLLARIEVASLKGEGLLDRMRDLIRIKRNRYLVTLGNYRRWTADDSLSVLRIVGFVDTALDSLQKNQDPSRSIGLAGRQLVALDVAMENKREAMFGPGGPNSCKGIK